MYILITKIKQHMSLHKIQSGNNGITKNTQKHCKQQMGVCDLVNDLRNLIRMVSYLYLNAMWCIL